MLEQPHKVKDITLALAGIFQAASLVRDLARTGHADEAAFQTCITSVFKIDAENVTSVYGSEQNLRLGLKELTLLLGHNKASTDPYIGRYVISLIHLERKLHKNPDLLSNLSRRVKYSVSQANYFSESHPTVIASLADTYLKTLGTLNFRIHVLGQAKYLNQPAILDKVRALLLAGIRSAVLWRQLGGNRWQLLLWRTRLVQTAKRIAGLAAA